MLWWRKVRKFMCYSPMKMPPTHALWLLFNALVTNVSRFYRCPSNFNELLHISHTVSFMNILISSHIHTNSHRNTKWNCPPPPPTRRVASACFKGIFQWWLLHCIGFIDSITCTSIHTIYSTEIPYRLDVSCFLHTHIPFCSHFFIDCLSTFWRIIHDFKHSVFIVYIQTIVSLCWRFISFFKNEFLIENPSNFLTVFMFVCLFPVFWFLVLFDSNNNTWSLKC